MHDSPTGGKVRLDSVGPRKREEGWMEGGWKEERREGRRENCKKGREDGEKGRMEREREEEGDEKTMDRKIYNGRLEGEITKIYLLQQYLLHYQTQHLNPLPQPPHTRCSLSSVVGSLRF